MPDTARPKSNGDKLSADEVNQDLPTVETAGETINGGTLPVPCFIKDSDGEWYASDANDTTKLQFHGFAVSNGTDGNDITIQNHGVVSGFSGLDAGKKYYVQDDKTLGTSPGTYLICVGVAISATEILILPKREFDEMESKTVDTVYEAYTDGIVTAYVTATSNDEARLDGYTDGSNPPTTKIAAWQTSTNYKGGFTFPVKKGNYWKVTKISGTATITIKWTPLN